MLALSLLSKEMAITLPAVLFGYSWIVGRKSARESLLRSLPYGLLPVVYIALRSAALGHTARSGRW